MLAVKLTIQLTCILQYFHKINQSFIFSSAPIEKYLNSFTCILPPQVKSVSTLRIFQQQQYSNRRNQKKQMQKSIPSKATHYKFTQLFGYKGPNEKILQEDIINTISFDHSGNYLAVGDKAGRVIVFQSKQSKKGPPSYDYFSEFQSHSRQFDPLRSMEIEEDIIAIKWLQNQGKYLKLITSNSRTIKLWKMFQKSQKKVIKSAGKELSMPKLQTIDTAYVSQLQKSFPTKHNTSINGVHLTKNEQYLLSSDQGQIFLWSVQQPDKPFLLVNYSPKEESQEQKQLITCSTIHPTSDSLFAYGMSKGTLKMGDLRLSSNVLSSCTSFGQNPNHKNYIYELLSSYYSIAFAKGGKYLATRDCLTVKLWDVCNPKKPVSQIILNDGLKSKLCQMVENESIFDKFSISPSNDGRTLLTGSYNNTFHMVDPDDNMNAQYELNYKKTTVVKSITKGHSMSRMDYSAKTMATDFNPKRNMVAVASKNCFFTYTMP